MFSLVLQRKQYALWIAALVAFKIVAIIAVSVLPDLLAYYRYIDTATLILIAATVAARFADIGWPRWLGYLSVFVLMVVVPLAILFATYGGKRFPPSARPFDVVPDLQWIGTIVWLLFLVAIGFIKSHPDSEALIRPPTMDNRIEPRMN